MPILGLDGDTWSMRTAGTINMDVDTEVWVGLGQPCWTWSLARTISTQSRWTFLLLDSAF